MKVVPRRSQNYEYAPIVLPKGGSDAGRFYLRVSIPQAGKKRRLLIASFKGNISVKSVLVKCPTRDLTSVYREIG